MVEPHEQSFFVQFVETTPHGVLCGVSIPKLSDNTALSNSVELFAPPELMGQGAPMESSQEDMAFCKDFISQRRASWLAGRFAIRFAAVRLGVHLRSVPSTNRGAPELPRRIVGSIAHKTKLAVALVDKAKGQSVGVDLEELDPPREKVAKLVLRSDELEQLSQASPTERWNEIIRIFSVKEAIFKALDPALQRYIGFQEACVSLRNLPDVQVELYLKHNESVRSLEARCLYAHQHVISSVVARIG